MLHFDINKSKPLSSLYDKKSSLAKVLFLSWLTTIVALSFIFITFSVYFKLNDFHEISISLKKAHIKSYQKILEANVESTIRITDNILSVLSPKIGAETNIDEKRKEVISQYMKLSPMSPKQGNIYIISPDKKILMYPGSTDKTGESIQFLDLGGNDFTDSAIRLSNRINGNDFVYYRNMADRSENKEKVFCFMKGEKNLNMIICSEIPQARLDAAVAMNLERLKINLYIEMGFAGGIFLLIIMLMIFYIFRLSNSIKSELSSIITFLENDHNQELISSFSPDNLQFREFAIIGESARSMVTKIKRLFDWLGKKALEAETANQTKTSLLSGITDDMNPELNIVAKMSEDLLKSGLSAEEQDKLNKIKNAVSNISSILENLQTTMLIDDVKFNINKEDINIKKIAMEAFSLIEPKAKDKNIQVNYIIDDLIPETCIGDATRIRQLIINIFENIVSSAKKGTINLELKTAESEGKLKLIFVAENKEEFYSEAELKEIRNYPNAKQEYSIFSLRVAVCEGIAGKLGGKFNIVSTEEHGTSFNLELTLEKAG